MRNKRNFWLAVGAVVLIVLVVVWLIIASFFGDTDVAADLLNMPAAAAWLPLG